MKKMIFGGLFLAIVGIAFVACEKEEIVESNNENVEEIISEDSSPTANKASRANQSVTITCAGECDCGMVGDLQSISCSCAECVMTLKFRDTKGNIIGTDNIVNAEMEVPLLEYFLDYASVNLENYRLTEITVYNNNDETATLFVYSINGVESSILYSTKASSGKVFEIDCTGSCDCREVYSFSTNSASCSCADCVMVVREITKK